MSFNSNLSLIHASFFFVDIVGLSNPHLSTKNQIKKIHILNESILKCNAYKTIPKNQLLILPTGDGMSIGFMQGPELPLQLAIQLQQILNRYNKSKIPTETIQVRIGLNSGPVFIVDDIQNNKNIWGPGIIMARRIMDLGDASHILLSSSMAKDLTDLSDYYKKIINPLHDYNFKHGVTMLVYSVFGKDFGNRKLPLKGIVSKSNIAKEIKRLRKSALYTSVRVEIQIKDVKTMLVHHKRTYEIQNTSEKPIKHVLHGIATDVKKDSLRDLNLTIYDGDKKEMKISSISLDKPYHKEFTTAFNKVIRKDQTQSYTLEYTLEEPRKYFENIFLVSCDKFYLKIIYPKNVKTVKLEIYEKDQESKMRKKITNEQKIRISKNNIISTLTRKNLKQGQIIRIKW